ncbi:MAG: helix-turn-helix transcriptional regulator [Vicinamibacteria bacterium]|nr:helix-turn-helix transcriptional regulator [Vicinamibacteria bacterium]
MASATPFGGLLRQWRGARRLSQLELALSADVSSRHLSYMETGRARPSRAMVLQLAGALDVPLRERNTLLHAAGYAPVYGETPLEDPALSSIREALALLLRHHEPLPAVALDRRWNVVMANAPYLASAPQAFGREPGPPLSVLPEPRANVLRLLFDPAGFKPLVSNWGEVAAAVLARVHREAHWSGDPEVLALLDELQAAPDAPPRASWFDPSRPPALVIPVEMATPLGPVRYFTTLTTLGAAQDLTLHELRIEAYHPADEESAERLAALCAGGSRMGAATDQLAQE